LGKAVCDGVKGAELEMNEEIFLWIYAWPIGKDFDWFMSPIVCVINDIRSGKEKKLKGKLTRSKQLVFELGKPGLTSTAFSLAIAVSLFITLRKLEEVI
jgi:hypothetical protein